MPEVDGKHYAYTKEGIAAAEKAKKESGFKMRGFSGFGNSPAKQTDDERKREVEKLEKIMAKSERGFEPPKEGGAYLFPKSPGALARKKKQQERYWDAQQERSQILFQKKN